MSAADIQLVFFIMLAAYAFAALSLDVLNLRYAAGRADKVPQQFKEYVAKDTYAKSASYTIAKQKLGMAESVFSIVLLVLIVISGFLGRVDALVHSLGLSPIVEGVVFIMVLSLLLSLLGLPFSLYGTFVVEQRFGFNHMTLKLWVLDLCKSLLVSAVLFIPLLSGILWFISAAGQYWWLYAFLFTAVFQGLILYIYPAIIAPWFNKFEALPEGELLDEIKVMIKRVAFKAAGVFVMDGSRRSAHGNAYFTGIGDKKRIVLFDTLLEQLNQAQITAVLAHEIGHQKMLHVIQLMCLSFTGLLVSFWVLSVLLNHAPFYAAFGLERETAAGALMIFMLAAGPLTFFLTPLVSMIVRRFEYQADRFAVAAVGNAEPLQTALIALHQKNLSNLAPHPWYSFFHYSHPTLAERLKALASCMQNTAAI